MSKISVVFDVDGTLIDTKVGMINALNYVLKKYGIDSIKKENEKDYIGPSIKSSLMKYNGFKEDDAISATKLYRQIYVEKYIVDSELYDGTKNLLRALKAKGYILSIATMKTHSQVKKIIDIFDLSDCFDYIEYAADDGTKNKRDMLLNIYNETMECERRIMVGDTMDDYISAKQSGYEFVMAEYGYGQCQDDDIYRIERIEDLSKITRI